MSKPTTEELRDALLTEAEALWAELEAPLSRDVLSSRLDAIIESARADAERKVTDEAAKRR